METVWKFLKSDKGVLCLAFLFAVPLFFLSLGADGIPAAQEGRTAIIVRNMLLTGNWCDMNIAHAVLYEKPIGHYWMCLPFAWLFGITAPEPGDLNYIEWGVRLPSAISAVLGLIAVAVLAKRIYGFRAAALSVFVTATMMTFLHLGRIAHIDMPLAAAFAWSMLFFYIGYLENWKANGWIYGFYMMLVWGMILIGPLVLILAGLVVLGMMIWSRRWKMLWEMRPLTSGLVFLIVTLPWYILETVRTNGAFFEEFIVNQNIRRFTGIGSVYRGGRRMPFYYYLPKMFAGALPWSLLSICALICFFKRILQFRFRKGSVFLLFWFLTGFLFFSFSALKRGDYLLPLYPALGILTAAAVLKGCSSLPGLSKRWIWGWGVAALLVAVILGLSFSGILIRVAEMGLSGTVLHVAASDAENTILISRFINNHAFGMILIALILLGILYYLGTLMQKRRYTEALLIFCGVIFVIYAVNNAVVTPLSAARRTVKPLAAEIRKAIPKDAEVVYYGELNTELAFFINRPYDKTIKPASRYLMMDDSAYRKFRKKEKWQEWTLRLQTEKDHQYPVFFFTRNTSPEK